MRVVVVGAGVGGLATAVRLAAAGHAVTVLEAGAAAGGKCGRVTAGGFTWDSGPSLLTMPWVFEALFADTGVPLSEVVELLPVEPVTRYRFADGTGFDLSADLGASRAALDAWRPGAGAEWARFMATCERMWAASEPVLTGPAPWPPSRAARASPGALLAVKPWWTLRQLARAHTDDPRMRMVIERFATYAGADPRRAPAALAVAGYVEHAWGAWHPRGGMYALVEALVARLAALGGELRLATPARRIALTAADSPLRRLGAAIAPGRAGGLAGALRRVTGVETDAGLVPADAVVTAIDAELVHRELLGRPPRPRERSLSGLALMLGLRGRTPDLVHHAITFPADYDAEFDAVFGGRPARDPTIYVSASCATDPGETPENWFVLVNAPPDAEVDWDAEAERLIDRLGVRDRIAARVTRSPADLARETGSAPIYGVAPHGRLGTLKRPATTVRGIDGLWLTGGTVHPGGGLPLVALGAATTARALVTRVAVLLAALALLAGCGGPTLQEASRGDLVYATGGEAAGRVTVIRRADAEPPYPVVLFLHGWGATEPRFYGPWLEHLARAGNAVVYPRYQQSVAELAGPGARQRAGRDPARVRRARPRHGGPRGGRALRGRRAGGGLRRDRRARRAAGAARAC